MESKTPWFDSSIRWGELILTCAGSFAVGFFGALEISKDRNLAIVAGGSWAAKSFLDFIRNPRKREWKEDEASTKTEEASNG